MSVETYTETITVTGSPGCCCGPACPRAFIDDIPGTLHVWFNGVYYTIGEDTLNPSPNARKWVGCGDAANEFNYCVELIVSYDCAVSGFAVYLPDGCGDADLASPGPSAYRFAPFHYHAVMQLPATNPACAATVYDVTICTANPCPAPPDVAPMMMATALPAPESPSAAPPTRGPCAFLGEPIGGEAASRLGLSVVRTWHPCALGHGTKGHVCKCDVAATCGACPDWTPGEPE